MTELHFHFDFVSPYAYLAWRWVRELCEEHGLDLVPEPTVLGVLLGHHGHLGPAEIPAKREFVFRDVLRVARRMGVEIGFPQVHPFNPLGALRLTLPEVAGDAQCDVIDALWDASWIRGVDVSTPGGLEDVLNEAGFDGEAMVARTREHDVKEALKARMDQALQRGVFGVPTFVVGDELFWGNDQRPALEAYLGGDRGYDDDQLHRFLNTPFGVRRPR